MHVHSYAIAGPEVGWFGPGGSPFFPWAFCWFLVVEFLGVETDSAELVEM